MRIGTSEARAMAFVLTVDEEFLRLEGPGVPAGTGRPLEADEALNIGRDYESARDGQQAPLAMLGIGKRLYAWLDGNERWLGRFLPAARPPLLLEIRSPIVTPGPKALAVLQAPWELLADDEGFLAAREHLDYAPARRLGRPEPPPALGPYRLGVAFMAGSPLGVEPELDFEADESAIARATPEGVDLLVEESGDPDELGRRLSRLGEHAPEVLHLSCHGHDAATVPGEPGSQPVLFLEGPGGEEKRTSAATLKAALRNYAPRLVFLSVCSTAAGRPGTAQSFAQALIANAIPAVLGWSGSVADVAATEFARRLYECLSAGMAATRAAGAARRALLGGAALEAAGDTAEAMRRDWHLARVWLGGAGGGSVCLGTEARLPAPVHKSFQQVNAARTLDKPLLMPDRAQFIGRRDLQLGQRALDRDKLN